MRPLPWLLVTCVLGGWAFADEPYTGGRHFDGYAEWTDAVARRATAICVRSAAPDCLESSIELTNHGRQPALCRVSAKLPQPDEDNRKVIDELVILAPGESQTTRSAGTKAGAPQDITTSCQAYPDSYTEPVVPAECNYEARMPNPEDFYPPGAKRRSESGVVVLDVAVNNDTRRFEELRVGRSAGFLDLDRAAVKLMRRSRVTTNCAGQRYAVRVVFNLRND